MAVTKTTRISYGQKIKGAIGSIFFGFLLFFGAFVLLFWNEGRQDMSKIAINAIEAQSGDNLNDGDFVAYYGEITTNEKLGDSFLKGGEYIALERNVEIYAWHETTTTTEKDNIGGSTDVTTTYDYEKTRTTNPEDSSNFQEKAGHQNPYLSINSDKYLVKNIKIDNYDLKINQLTLPGYEKLQLDKNMLKVNNIKIEETTNTGGIYHTGLEKTTNDLVDLFGDNQASKTNNDKEKTIEKKNSEIQITNNSYLFSGHGTIDNPKIGDIRISYSVIRPNQGGTVFGIKKGNSILAFMDQKGNRVYRLFRGTKAEAVAMMHNEYKKSLRLFRIVGIFLMWAGLSMMLSLIPTLASVIPFLSKISGGILKIVTFIISLVLGTVTILVSMIVHNVIVLIIVLVLVMGLLYFLWKKKKNSEGTNNIKENNVSEEK